MSDMTPEKNVLEAYRHDADSIRLQMTPPSWSGMAILNLWDALKASERERDLAVAHDRQPYPTAAAYEAACIALERKTKALGLIGDVAFDRDGYSGNAEALGHLVDEIHAYARRPYLAARISDGVLERGTALAPDAPSAAEPKPEVPGGPV